MPKSMINMKSFSFFLSFSTPFSFFFFFFPSYTPFSPSQHTSSLSKMTIRNPKTVVIPLSNESNNLWLLYFDRECSTLQPTTVDQYQIGLHFLSLYPSTFKAAYLVLTPDD